ncbi:hypothetical protein CHS0354_014459 [Potamilus streckersoni]|uniref:Uncharacterized protein n=1 Tax=Potamilus streckersoni TaxID=2493646 RepID=A0AAE0SA60_9BIVA|nr:hypothetical protein CHS0354_014459 [Potamilus streckersoni]
MAQNPLFSILLTRIMTAIRNNSRDCCFILNFVVSNKLAERNSPILNMNETALPKRSGTKRLSVDIKPFGVHRLS